MAAGQPAYDRLKEVTEFDTTKAGVKGLVDSGVRKVPRIFIHAPEDLPKPSTDRVTDLQVPVIDIGHIDDPSRRQEAVASVGSASESWGFFQLVNHGIPAGVLDRTVRDVRRFHEQDAEAKAELYTRDSAKKVRYECNFDLYQSRAANWRDTLNCVDDGSLDPDDVPAICREAVLEYYKQVSKVGDTLFALLSESLGLDADYLKNMNCAKTQHMVAHYYPPCPEPDLTLGTTKHTDGSFVTLLLQDGIGGLQVLHRNEWVDVPPVRGALVVNIGDLLQLVSNDKFKSVQHRVLASCRGPRISVAVFLYPRDDEERLYGPIKEILSDENPPKYREIHMREYLAHFVSKGLGKEHFLGHFKL